MDKLPNYLNNTRDFHTHLFFLSCYISGQLRLDSLTEDELDTLMRLERDMDELNSEYVTSTVIKYLDFLTEPGTIH